MTEKQGSFPVPVHIAEARPGVAAPTLAEPEGKALAGLEILDIEMHNVSIAMRRLEQARDLAEIQSVSNLIEQLLEIRRARLRIEGENRWHEGERAHRDSIQERLLDFERKLVFFKLGFTALMFSSGVALTLNNFEEIGLFILGGAVTLLTETFVNAKNA